MAEVVERNLESSAAEVIYVKKLKLFNDREVNELIRKRRQHEYSLQKRNKRVLDYDAYISTELAILRLLRLRRQQIDDRRHVDKIERPIIQRLVRLHQQLCYRFQSRIDVWMRFIQVCKILGRHMSVVRLWNRCLQVHGRTDPRLWAAAASYHLHEHTKVLVRSTLRNLSRESEQLSEEQKSTRHELSLLTHHTDKRKKSSVRGFLKEMQEQVTELDRASSQLSREKRLVYDSVYLDAIREARRLLTEGLILNPECGMLHLELVKLEANAADFFNSRILHRANSASAHLDALSDRVDSSTQNAEGATARKKVKRMAKVDNEDNATFMAGVTEDVPFVASGGAFRLVVEAVTERFASDPLILNSLNAILSSVPHLSDDSILSVLNEKVKKLDQTKPSPDENKVLCQSAKFDEQMALSDRIAQLNEAVLNGGIGEALSLWDSWYTQTDPNHNNPKESFRFVDPSIPESVSLLRTRLLLCTVDHCQTGDATSADSPRYSLSVSTDINDFVCRTRRWLDQLATSRWGKTSPDFWFEYVEFERKSGDCTRIPSVQWRASKTLTPEAYSRFTHLLNSTLDNN
ncbi:unnamed protein product [Calicophoron daubneyi]|uniref:U3 small nucleolar RNA-associated protein 6 N-terminal domain-containing protein n=1 Tax=Calicophoron daubneyi TaxID=300641 RepID=A0AAV2TMQ4_CALDB